MPVNMGISGRLPDYFQEESQNLNFARAEAFRVQAPGHFS